MSGASIRWIVCLMMAVFATSGCKEKESPVIPPGPEVEEDPLERVRVPGAYGVPGGDQILQLSRQSSTLFYGNSFSYRLLDPSTLTVVSLSGFPKGLEEGDTVSFTYRLVRRGVTIATARYDGVKVIKTGGGMAWLKKDENCFFVIELP